MKPKRYLSFDCGSSTGRVIAGSFDGRVVSLEPVYSFPNRPVSIGGSLHWNILSMFDELKNALRKAMGGGGFESISVDSWGCDFALIGRDGKILQNLSCYRDESIFTVKDEVNALMSPAERYRASGVAATDSSTALRLYQLARTNPSALDAAEYFLQIADLFNYLLSGEARGEYTLATTSQLIDPATASWSERMFGSLGIPIRLAPPLADSGTFLGRMTEARIHESGICEASVYAACCHDSAAAMTAMPLDAKDALYVSSGSWSVGMLRAEKPILSPPRPLRFMHEGAWGRKPRLSYNLIGLWMAQQLRRESGGISYDELEAQAAAAVPFARVFVPEAVASFGEGNLKGAISAACAASGQPEPRCDGDYLRAVYDSLAINYRALIKEAENFLGYPLRAVCVAGGGARSGLLNEATAEATGLPVTVGPVEAAVAGNILAQMRAHGEIGGEDDARKILGDSFGVRVFEPTGKFERVPRAIELWDAMAEKFLPRGKN
jgi:rhamnulokinase/L-fuculokinase